MKNFYVIEGEHTNPNEIETILKNTEKKHGPFEEQEATQIAKGLIQKNIGLIGYIYSLFTWSKNINYVYFFFYI